jgi:hypothetical protein
MYSLVLLRNPTRAPQFFMADRSQSFKRLLLLMSSIAISLSSRSLVNMVGREGFTDFVFIVGESRYRCNSLLADFLSPRIADLHTSDAAVSEFVIETKDPDDDFEAFLSLGDGKEVTVESRHFSFFVELSEELLNDELRLQLFEGPAEEGSVRQRFLHLTSITCPSTKEFDFVASHLYKLLWPDVQKLIEIKGMGVSLLSELFSSPKLMIENENWLCELICELVEKNAEYFQLFDFVQFEFVSNRIIPKFFECLSVRELSMRIWRNLRRRLALPVMPRTLKRRFLLHETTFLPKVDRALNGIISHLTSECGGNVHELNVVDVTASSEAYR